MGGWAGGRVHRLVLAERGRSEKVAHLRHREDRRAAHRARLRRSRTRRWKSSAISPCDCRWGWRWQGCTTFPTPPEQKLSGCETVATTRSRIAHCHACSGASAAEQKSGRSAAEVTFVAVGVPERHGDAGNSPRIKKFSRRRGHDAVLPFSSVLLMVIQACTYGDSTVQVWSYVLVGAMFWSKQND